MARRVIDLSQPLCASTPVPPVLGTVQILRHLLHSDFPPGAKSFDAEIVVTSNHAATHVDALSHFDPRPHAPKIAEMPLELFCGDSVCVDARGCPAGHALSVRELEQALARGRLEVREGDILLFCTDHYNLTRHNGDYLSGYSGVGPDCVYWMRDHGVRTFGVEAPSPDLVYLTDAFPTHRACAECGISHYENLTNLSAVVNTRFVFFGLPLRLQPASGSPVRAVALVDD
jgi:kynurenine formamidase